MLKVIGCNRSAVNTGFKSGVIKTLEIRLKRPLQWIIFLLYANALPFRHTCQALDGQTTGSNEFSGSKNLENVKRMEVINNYKRIESQLPEVNFKDLSTDQKYSFENFQAVSSGIFPLVNRKPGKNAHSRWFCVDMCPAKFVPKI